jgi:formate C-acetyltransferase
MVKQIEKNPMERLEQEPFGGCTLRVRRARERKLATPHSICIEAPKIMTEVFMKTEGEPVETRKAKYLRDMGERATIFIQDGELIVGNAGSKINAGICTPDGNYGMLSEELDTLSTRAQDPYLITEDERRLAKEFIEPYWKGKSFRDVWLVRTPKDIAQLVEEVLIVVHDKTYGGPSVIAPDYNRIISLGTKGIKKAINERLASLDASIPGDYEKKTYLEALLIVCDAMERRAKRYADLARDKAAEENDHQRKAELEKIAEICEHVPANPARTFWEALQSLWFYHIFLWMEHNCTSYNPGRIDQYLYPYYKRDIEEGRLTKEEAQELLECLWVKFSENTYFEDGFWAEYAPGYLAGQNVSCGGVTKSGQDAVNELSYMMLQATMDVRLNQPQISVKYNKAKNPDSFLRKAVQLVALGTGHPPFYNDEVGIKHVLDMGASLEEANSWNPKACMETALNGKVYNLASAIHVNAAACVELAMLNGVKRETKRRLPVPQTGNPKNFKTYEDFENAVKKHLQHLVKKAAEENQIMEVVQQEERRAMVSSLGFEECIEKGKDLICGGAKYNLGPEVLVLGVQDLANSLIAVKKLIYQDQKLTWDELLEALDDDFEGHKEIYEMCLSAPKYGNDIPEVDEIITEMSQFAAEDIRRYKGLRGGKMLAETTASGCHLAPGEHLGALPSGRRAWKPLGDGISAMQGTDRKGPTAALKSISKFRIDLFTAGSLINMKLDPSIVRDERGIQSFMNLIKGWYDLGLYQIQFNVVSPETLRDAQKHPENYREMLVRVSGYSAYFVELDKRVQDDIISRTTMTALV